MVATIKNFTVGGVNTPGIDAGTFTVGGYGGTGGSLPNDILIITKMRFPVSLIVTETVSTGASGYAPTQSAGLALVGTTVNLGRAPAVSVFTTVQSSGAWIPVTELAPGQSYQWIAVGL